MTRGYSMIELVVTIAIVAILAAIAVPLFNQPEIDASWFNEQVRAAVRYAQRQAVAQRRSVFVVVGASNVRLCYDAGCASVAPELATGAAYQLNAPSGVILGPATFSFDALGRPTPLSGTSLIVAGKTITVNGETGYVQ